MDESVKVEVNLTNTCHGCLSNNRTIIPLGELSGMLINVLGSYKQCLVYGVEDIRICWECTALLKRFKSFQHQIREAQTGLMKMLYEIDAQTTSLSKLTTISKFYFDQDIKYLSKARLKKNKEQLESITIIKTEFEDLHTYSDDDDMNLINIDRTDTFDSKVDQSDSKGEVDSIVDETDSKVDAADSKFDEIDSKELNVAKDENMEFTYDIKAEPIQEATKVKKPRRKKDTKCVNNVVGYYKRYATLVKTEKKDWGSWEDVRNHFKKVLFSEKEMEDHFFIKDRRNTSYHRMAHRCETCTLGYTKEVDLKRHNDLNHHKEGTNFKCSLCNKRQQSAECLSQHWRTHSAVYKCRMCSDVCKENFMRKHLDHAHTNTYACTVCPQQFRTLKSFTIHYKEMHMNYICDYCNHTLTTKKKMEKHICEHHMTYTCKDCNRSYKNYIYYKKHCYALHPHKIKAPADPELSFCVECNKQFPSVDKYKTHLRVSPKHNNKPSLSLPCPDCGKIFGRKKNLTYHYNLFHLKKTQFYCEICDKYFARPSGLRTHRENVHLKIEKVKDKICDLCGRGFSSHVVLRHHRRTHTGERPHKCPHCSAEFIQKYAMQTHVRTQHKEAAKDRRNWQDAAYFV